MRTTRLIATLAAIAVLLAVTRADAQLQLARLEGRVVDAAGLPVVDATVSLTDPLGAELRRASTDAQGGFVIVEVAPGRYRLRAAASGASRAELPVTVDGAWPLTVTLRLPPSFRDALVVQANVPTESVASRSSIGGDSITNLPTRVRGRGLQEIVATMPGWSTEDNGLLHSRGVDDGFLYVIDGVPVYERLDQTSGVAPDAATIDQVTVVTGYVPPEFGYKAGGVIELRTRGGGSPWKGSYELGAGSDASRDSSASLGGRLGRAATIWLGAAGQESDRFLDPVHPDNLHNAGGAASTSGQIESAFAARDRVVGGWSYGRASFDVPNTEAQDAAGQNQRQRVGQGGLSVSWQRTWSPATVSHVASYHRDTSSRLGGSDEDTPLTADASRHLRRSGVLAGVAHQRGRHLFKAGMDAQRLALREEFAFAVTDEDEAEEAGLSEEALEHDLDDPFTFSSRAHPTLWSLYVQDSWQAAAALTVAAGLRFDRSTMLLTRSQWSPRVGLAYRADDRTTVRASVSRFYQPPQPENLLLSSSEEARALSPFEEDGVEGGADVEPERQWAYEAGVEHRLRNGLRLDAAYWRRQIEEAADPNVFFGTTIIFPNAVAEGRAQGFDLRLEWPRRGAWSGYANWSVAKVVQTGPITGGLFLEDEVGEIGPGTEFTPDHDQRMTLSGGLTWTASRAVVSLVGRYETGTPIEREDEELDELRARPGAEHVDFDSGRVEPRTLVSASVTWRLWQSPRYATSVRASVLNLFGDRYAYNFGNPFSGTHFGAARSASIAFRIEAR